MTTSVSKSLSGIVILSCLIVIQSCNSGDKKEKDPPVQTTTPGGTTPKAAFAIGPFTVLKLEKQSLLDLFPNTGDAKKLLIQFSDDGSSIFMQGAAFAANKSNIYQNTIKILSNIIYIHNFKIKKVRVRVYNLFLN